MFGNTQQINEIKSNVDDLSNKLPEIIDQVLDRGEKIEVLVKKTDNLQREAVDFHFKANKLNEKNSCSKQVAWGIFGSGSAIGVSSSVAGYLTKDILFYFIAGGGATLAAAGSGYLLIHALKNYCKSCCDDSNNDEETQSLLNNILK